MSYVLCVSVLNYMKADLSFSIIWNQQITSKLKNQELVV